MSDSKSMKEEEAELIDITWIIDQFWYAFKRLWWLVFLLIAVFTGLSYYRTIKNFVPSYHAEATLTISAAGEEMSAGSDNYNNVASAQQLGKIFPYILTSGVLSDAVAEDMGESSVPGSISVTSVKGTNLITIRTTASEPEKAYAILQSVIKVYPSVAQFVVGQTRANILDDSGVPGDSSKVTVTRRSLMKGAFIGACFGALILGIYVLMRRTILSSRQLKNLMKFPCLGVLPLFQVKKYRKAKGKRMNLLLERVPQDYLESIRALRTKVDRELKKRGQKTFMVTSSVPSEGKSTIATNLAISFAQQGIRVILVDCDLRNPSIQKCLNVNGEFLNLEAVIKKEASLDQALYQIPTDGLNLRVLFGAPEAKSGGEIFTKEEIRDLLRQLEEEADLVILDACPAAMLADALMWAQNVPETLYVVRYDYTKIHSILEGVQELTATGTDIIGCVLNQNKYYSVHGYGYGYGRYGRYRQSHYGGYGQKS